MQCNNCPALKIEGYEYPEYYCGLGVQDNNLIEFKNGEYGCMRRSISKIKKDLKIQIEIENKAFVEFARDFVKYIEEEISK